MDSSVTGRRIGADCRRQDGQELTYDCVHDQCRQHALAGRLPDKVDVVEEDIVSHRF